MYCVGPLPPTHENLPSTETTAKGLISPDRRSEAEPANGFMAEGDQSRVDVSSSIADLLTQERRMRMGFWNVRTLFQSGILAQAIREMSDYNLAIMGITESKWTGAG